MFPYRHSSCAGQQNIRKVPYASYLIFYKVHETERIVEILRFWHATRDQRRLRLKEENHADLSGRKTRSLTLLASALG